MQAISMKSMPFPSVAGVNVHQLIRVMNHGHQCHYLPRVIAENSLTFPAHPLAHCEWNASEPTMVLTYLALYGVSSPLPHYFMTDAQQVDNPALRRFLDIFHQSIYRAYFRAWQAKHFYLYQETLAPLHQTVLGLCRGGVPLPGLSTSTLPLFLGGVRSAWGFKQLLTYLLGQIPFYLDFEKGTWLPHSVGPAHLGYNALLGRRIYSIQSALVLHIGPAASESLSAYTPFREASAAFIQTLQAYLGGLKHVWIMLHIIPPALSSCLGQSIQLGEQCFLGNPCQTIIKKRYHVTNEC